MDLESPELKESLKFLGSREDTGRWTRGWETGRHNVVVTRRKKKSLCRFSKDGVLETCTIRVRGLVTKGDLNGYQSTDYRGEVPLKTEDYNFEEQGCERR